MSDQRRLERTEVPGVYRRDRHYVVRFKHKGRCVKRIARSLEAAVEIRDEHLARRDPVVAELLRRKRAARVRQRADLNDAYGYVRQALQAIDKARLSMRQEQSIGGALREAEDRIKEAIAEAAYR